VPYGTDSRLNRFQAINCLATIVPSLRDINASFLRRKNVAGIRTKASTPRTNPQSPERIPSLDFPTNRQQCFKYCLY
jgi:hypothetical protein